MKLQFHTNKKKIIYFSETIFRLKPSQTYGTTNIWDITNGCAFFVLMFINIFGKNLKKNTAAYRNVFQSHRYLTSSLVSIIFYYMLNNKISRDVI